MSTTFGEIDNKYTLVKKIGSGGTSKVYLAHKIDDPKEMFAVKIIKGSNSQESKFFMNEINNLKKVKHKNVVSLIDGGEGILTKETGKKHLVQYLVLELVKYGELFDFIFFPQIGFGEEIGKYILLQLLDGLEACHNAGIVHRDMKTENIMLGENWQMKIADFGFATKLDGKKGNGLLYTALGTASYASPELLQKKPYLGVQSDIFSLGVSLFILVTGKMPFKHAIDDDPYYKEIVKGNIEKYWSKLENKVPEVSADFKSLFVKFIAYDPTSRPSISEIRENKWIKGFKPDTDKINFEFRTRSKQVVFKKEQQRKKEELEKMNEVKEKFQIYKSHDSNEEHETCDDYDIREYDPESPNFYSYFFKKETHPGKLFDYLIKSIKKNHNIEFKKVDGKYKVSIGCKPAEDKDKHVKIGNDSLIDMVEALLEIKKNDEGLVVEVTRTLGNKYDFHNLFHEIGNLSAISC